MKLHRLVVVPALAAVLVVAAACGSGDGSALDTLPPVRTTTTLSTTTTSIDPRDVIYIVQPGDYLSEIARRYQVTIAMIVELNDLPNNGETIQPGQELQIPNIRVDVTLPTLPPTTENP